MTSNKHTGQPHPLFGSSAAPYYAQLADIFRQRIAKGVWRAGDILPPLDALMTEFSVARVTVRQAVKLLSDEGQLSPQRGRGTLVTGEPGGRRKLRVDTTLADLVEMYRGDQPVLSNVLETMEAPLVTESEGGLAERYFHMRRIHEREGVKYCVISLYIEYGIFSRAPEAFRKDLILPVLFSLPDLPIGRARQTLVISKCDVDAAQLMDFPVGDPVAEVRRIIYDKADRILYLADVTYRGDYIHLDMDLRP